MPALPRRLRCSSCGFAREVTQFSAEQRQLTSVDRLCSVCEHEQNGEDEKNSKTVLRTPAYPRGGGNVVDDDAQTYHARRKLRCNSCGRATSDFSPKMECAPANERVCAACHRKNPDFDPNSSLHGEARLEAIQHAHGVPDDDKLEKSARPMRCNACGLSSHDFDEDNMCAEPDERLCRACVAKHASADLNPDQHVDEIHHAHGVPIPSDERLFMSDRPIRCTGCSTATHNFTEEMVAAPPELRLCRLCQAACEMARESATRQRRLEERRYSEMDLLEEDGAAVGGVEFHQLSASSPVQNPSMINKNYQHNKDRFMTGRPLRCNLCGHASHNFTQDMVALPVEERFCRPCVLKMKSMSMAEQQEIFKRAAAAHRGDAHANAARRVHEEGHHHVYDPEADGPIDDSYHHQRRAKTEEHLDVHTMPRPVGSQQHNEHHPRPPHYMSIDGKSLMQSRVQEDSAATTTTTRLAGTRHDRSSEASFPRGQQQQQRPHSSLSMMSSSSSRYGQHQQSARRPMSAVSAARWQAQQDKDYTGARRLRCAGCGKASRNYTMAMATELPEDRFCRDCAF